MDFGVYYIIVSKFVVEKMIHFTFCADFALSEEGATRNKAGQSKEVEKATIHRSFLTCHDMELPFFDRC